MPKYKPPQRKKFTIRNGRVYKTTMNRPHFSNLHIHVPAEAFIATPSPFARDEPAQLEDVTHHTQHTQHTKPRVQERDAWEKVKKGLRTSFYEASCPDEGPCIICQKPHSHVTCRECSQTGHVFCRECAVKMHKQHCLLHNIVEWQNEHPIIVGYQCTFSRANHECSSMHTRSVKIFNDRGHLYSAFVRFCDCESSAATLIRYGLWPCTAQTPATAIALNFMNHTYCLMMEGQISLKAVCHAVGNHSCLLDSEVNLLYRSIVGECMEQFRYFRHNIRNLVDIPREWSPLACPACPKNGPLLISLDANFGLVRKTSSGTSNHPPNHCADLFVEDTEVHTFIQDYDGIDNVQPDDINKDCSNFQAGSTIRTKNQSKKLETTGVFGAACRHGVPLVFLNMEHGERLVYPVMTIHKILAKLCNDTSVIILYDIACKLHAHLQKRGNVGADILKRVDLAVPVFHAYGHKRSCQIAFSTKWSSGVGLTDGEIMERIWAFLRKFAHITKEMTPSHRVDLLTDALYYFTQKKIDNIDIYLRAKMENAKKVERESSSELTCVLLQCEGTLEDVTAWRQEEKTNASKNARTQGTSFTWDEKYVKELMEYVSLRNQLHLCSDTQRVSILNNCCEKLQSSLSKTEGAHQIRTRWQEEDAMYIAANKSRQTKEKKELLTNVNRKACDHSFAVTCLRKYSVGQSLAKRLAQQVKATAVSLRRAVKAYNDRDFTDGALPNEISYQDVVNPESPIYIDIQGSGLTAVKQNAVDILNKVDRAREEQQLLMEEMKQFLSTRKAQHIALSQYLVNLVNEAEMPQWQRGIKHLISIKLMTIEGQHQRAATAFREYIDVQELYNTHQDYCTNVHFFPSHYEEASTGEILYSDMTDEMDDDNYEEDVDDFSDNEAPLYSPL